MTYRFFLIDNFLCLDTSAVFKILRLHFLMMFRFCAAILSIVRFASSRKVTSRCQCILSMLQRPLTARPDSSMSSFMLLMKYRYSSLRFPSFSRVFFSIMILFRPFQFFFCSSHLISSVW